MKCITAQRAVFFKYQGYHHFCEGGINLKSNRVSWVRSLGNKYEKDLGTAFNARPFPLIQLTQFVTHFEASYFFTMSICASCSNLPGNPVCDLLARRSTYQLVGDCSCYSVTPWHPLDSRDTDLSVLNPLFFGNPDIESEFITRSVTVLSRVKLTLIPLAHWLTILASWITC